MPATPPSLAPPSAGCRSASRTSRICGPTSIGRCTRCLVDAKSCWTLQPTRPWIGFCSMMDPVTLRTVTFETTLGRCAVRWTASGVDAVLLPHRSGRPGPRIEDDVGIQSPIREAIDGMTAVMAGEPRDLRHVLLDERRVDPFRRAVYAATREILAGTTKSYGEVARAIGRPDAAREVGAALARNPSHHCAVPSGGRRKRRLDWLFGAGWSHDQAADARARRRPGLWAAAPVRLAAGRGLPPATIQG